MTPSDTDKMKKRICNHCKKTILEKKFLVGPDGWFFHIQCEDVFLRKHNPNLTVSDTDKMEWEKEFDKWFNHGTKKEPRFAYASGIFPEVKEFIRTELQKAAEEARVKVVEYCKSHQDELKSKSVEEMLQMQKEEETRAIY